MPSVTRSRALTIAVLAAALHPGSASAATPAPKPAPTGTSVPAADDADLSLDAVVRMRSIRFDTVPKNAHITVTATPGAAGTSVRRYGIPASPQAGKTYVNAGIVVHAATRLARPSPSPSPRTRN